MLPSSFYHPPGYYERKIKEEKEAKKHKQDMLRLRVAIKLMSTPVCNSYDGQEETVFVKAMLKLADFLITENKNFKSKRSCHEE
jgi:hypothetical protein